jgi:hypothetical protein
MGNMYLTDAGEFDVRGLYNEAEALSALGHYDAASALIVVADGLPVPSGYEGGTDLARQAALDAANV